MVIKVYISGISGSQDMRKKQQRVLFILESLKVEHEVVDITEPGKEDERTFMREECSKKGKNNVLPPQIFVDAHYLGDYTDFEIATENDNLMTFLQLPERKFSRDRNGESNAEEILGENENQGGSDLVNGLSDLTNGQVESEIEQLEVENEEKESEPAEEETDETTNKADSEEEKEEEEEEEEEDEE